MRYYFAPLEGITDSIYRRLHHKYFPGLDRYYTPFLSPTVHRCLTPKEQRELPPADSLDFFTVPQLLTKNPEDFLWLAGICRDLGYQEINLNLGCPSGTVTAKGKGSGMLKDPESLDRFLDAIFTSTPIDISVKTRLGFTEVDEFPALLEIFNRYPIKELIIHPRVRKAFYGGNVDMDAFCYAMDHSPIPLCYNGDIISKKQIDGLPTVKAVMIGRGLIADPGMLCPGGTDRTALENFYHALLEEYLVAFGGSRNAMFRLKEHWHLLIHKFGDSQKLGNRLKKTTDLSEYKAITREIFQTLPMLDEISAI